MIQDWNDLRYFIVLAKHCRLAPAAAELGVSVSTLFRRLNRFEEDLATRLFDRHAAGYQLTSAGELLQAEAEQMHGLVDRLNLTLAAQDYQPAGRVRVTTTESIATFLLAPLLPGFHQQYPHIEIELAVDVRLQDLSRYEADIAIRSAPAPPESLIGRRWCQPVWRLYGTAELLARHPAVRMLADVASLPLITPVDVLARNSVVRAFLAKIGDGKHSAFYTNNLNQCLHLALRHVGLAYLPAYMVAAYPELVALDLPELDQPTTIWLLMHADLAPLVRNRLFVDYLFAQGPPMRAKPT